MGAAAKQTLDTLDALPVLQDDGIGYEPTIRAELAFGQWTMPLREALPVPATPHGGIVKPSARTPSPTPNPSAAAAAARRNPGFVPPPSAKRSLAIGFTIGTSLGIALLGAAWHFFL
jgi:hypothetical protein